MSDDRRRPRQESSIRSLDQVDATIMGLLRRSGRLPFAVIAQDVGLSEEAVRQRVRRLQARGALRIVTLVDPAANGLLRHATVGICVDGAVEPVVAELAGVDEIHRIVSVAGSFDLIAHLACADDARLLEVLNTKIRVISQVRSCETFIRLGDFNRA